MDDSFLSRRRFLAWSAGALCCGLGPARLALAGEKPFADPYCLANQDRLLREFAQFSAAARGYLEARHGPALARDACGQAEHLFRGLLPGFPPVGGQANWTAVFIPISGWYLAYYRAMRPHGLTARDVGRMMYDLSIQELRDNPEMYAAMGAEFFSPGAVGALRAWAGWTQQRDYAFNWVARFVPGDGGDFDFGYDYSECGLLKYLSAQGAPELAAYQCLIDFPRSRAEGTGLVREGSLAMGHQVCDFRYKRGRPVLQDWDSEIAKVERQEVRVKQRG